jgi:hypothetical protein
VDESGRQSIASNVGGWRESSRDRPKAEANDHGSLCPGECAQENAEKGSRAEMIYNVPTHRERQLMQHLRGGGWVKASVAPAGAKLIENLLAKGWIERRGLGNELSYRITDEGLAAKKAQVPIYS